jgi:hypothetical protein
VQPGDGDGDGKPKEGATSEANDGEVPTSAAEPSAPATIGSASTQRAREQEAASAPIPEETSGTSGLRRHDSIPPSADDADSFEDETEEQPPGPTIFVTDPTVEAARIEWALRARGYVVIDVPLAMLVGRAAVQKPHLVLLDVDAPGALEVAARVRQIPHGGGVHMIYAGHPGQTFSTSADAIAHEGSGFFARPIDVEALVEKIDTLLGVEHDDDESAHEPAAPERPPSNRPMPMRRSSRPPPPSLRAPASPIPPRPFPLPPAMSSPGPVSLGPPLSNDDRPPPSQPSQQPMSPRSVSDRPPGQKAWSAKAAEARLSPDLERLLKEAEQRVAGPTSQRGPESTLGGDDEVLSPEDEVEAVLPAEILASLDDPLDADGDDDNRSDVDTGTPHQTTGRETRGKSTTAGTASGVAPHTTGSGGAGGAGAATGAGTSAGVHAGEDDQPVTTSGGREGAAEQTSDLRTATTPKPPRRVPGESRAITSQGISQGVAGGGGHDADEERSLSQVSQPAAIPHPASEHPPPLAPTTARPPPPTAHVRPPTFDEPSEPVETPHQPIVSAPQTPSPGVASSGAWRAVTPEPAPVTGVAPLPAPRPIASPDEALRALAYAVATRITGVLRVDEPAGIRRIVLQDGDVVTAASSVEGESLLGYLQSRGDLAADVVKRLAGRVPPFGRLAGAALVAHGHLHQDQLWDVLQAHAAWLLTRAIATTRGQIAYEAEPPARLKGEPPVFGGTPGPALVVEITRRAISPAESIARLGGLDARLTTGERARLVDECGLEDQDDELVRRVAGATLRDVVATRGDDAATLVYALVALGVIGAVAPARPVAAQGAAAHDEEPVDPVRDAEMDDAALRARIVARRSLVEDGDYFAILGVPRVATGYEIKRAYLDLRRALDPSRVLRPSLGDLVDDLNLVLQVIDEAYDVLKDATRRERYRRAISHEPPQA